ncbi:MAG TPA: hypothetical protein GXZ22_05270 [Clostridiaceae bacterium]|nr:hypothetical protein [Clostridiaceae bacterium]
MKKAFITVFSIILIAAVFYAMWGRDLYYNIRDKKYWAELSTKISTDQIEEVSLDYKVILEGDEFKKFIIDLNAADFYRSNWRKHGPTGPIITIKFKDGTSQNFQYWGKGIFETYFDKGQFLIRKIELDTILEKYDIDLI